MQTIQHQFLEYIPAQKEPGILYVSLEYATASHLCPCGCGNVIVTPLAPSKWSLTFDGETVSLVPSIGNWSLPCKSHYWIDHGRIRMARQFSDREIKAVRQKDNFEFRGKATVKKERRRSGRKNGKRKK